MITVPHGVGKGCRLALEEAGSRNKEAKEDVSKMEHVEI